MDPRSSRVTRPAGQRSSAGTAFGHARPRRCASSLVRRSAAVVSLCLPLFLLAAACGGPGKPSTERPARVGILQFGPDPTIDQARQGVLDALREEGFIEGRTLEVDFRQGGGDYEATQAIARSFAAEPKDLIIPLTTPGLQAAIAATRQVPVVFTAVYDPFRAGAGRGPEDHLKNVTGVASFPPVEETFRLIRELKPEVRVIGTVWHPAEVCAASSLKVGRRLAAEMGLELRERTVRGPAEVEEAAELLADEGVELLYITGDNTVLLNFQALVRVARERQIPLVINDNDLCPQGAAASVGFNFYASGLAGGRMAARVLRGEDPAEIPIASVVVRELWVNPAEAARQGLLLPASVVVRADRVAQ